MRARVTIRLPKNKSLRPLNCPFEKAILSTRCDCALAERYVVGERTGVRCRAPPARRDCIDLVKALRDNARFALKVTDTTAGLAFGKEMRILYGGLAGLQRLLDPGATADGRAADIHALVEAARRRYHALDALPYPELVRDIAAYRLTRRGGSRS
jgi:hypothetical protein